MLYRNSYSQSGASPARHVSPSSPTLTCCVAFVLSLGCASASAANWEIAPRVGLGYRYNDNYHLELPGGEIEVSGAEADAAVTFRTLDPRTTFEVTPRIRSTYFPDERDEDSTDYFLDLRFDDTTPRRRTGLRLDASQEDVVRSELPGSDIDGDLGVPDQGDSGRVIERNRRDMVRFRPYFSYDVSQRYRLDVEAHYIDVAYDKTLSGLQEDYTEMGVAAGGGVRLTPRSTLSLRGTYAQYETGIDADAYGAYAEWMNELSPNSRVYVRLGGQETKPDGGRSDTSITGGVGGSWSSPRNQLFLDLTRTVGPVSAGTIVERYQFRLRLNHDISERVKTVLGARLSRDEPIDDASIYPEREYITAEAGLEWRFRRQFAFTATYNYRWQEYSNEPSDASANGFLIGIVYEPKRAE